MNYVDLYLHLALSNYCKILHLVLTFTIIRFKSHFILDRVTVDPEHILRTLCTKWGKHPGLD